MASFSWGFRFYFSMKVRVEGSEEEVESSKEQSSEQSLIHTPSLPKNRRTSRRGSRGNVPTPLTSSGVLTESVKSDDIIGVAKARLKRELRESDTTALDQNKGQSAESKRLQRLNRERQDFGTGKKVKFEEMEEGRDSAMILTGRRLEVIENPGTYVSRFGGGGE